MTKAAYDDIQLAIDIGKLERQKSHSTIYPHIYPTQKLGYNEPQDKHELTIQMPICPKLTGGAIHTLYMTFQPETPIHSFDKKRANAARAAYKRIMKEAPDTLGQTGLYQAMGKYVTVSFEAPKEVGAVWSKITIPVKLKTYAMHDHMKNFDKMPVQSQFLHTELRHLYKLAGETEEQYLDKIKDLTQLTIDVKNLGKLISLYTENAIHEYYYNSLKGKELTQKKLKREAQQEARFARKLAKQKMKAEDDARLTNVKLTPDDYEHMFVEETKPTLVGFL